MKTLVLEQPRVLRLTDTAPPDQPAVGEALVRVRRVGICGTDLHAYKGEQPFFSYPRILGHELGVEVVALDPSDQVVNLAVGERRGLNPYPDWGVCGVCRRGTPNC